MAKETRRQQLNALWANLENDKSSFITHWRDLSDNILPRRAQFTVSNTNRGEKRNQKIIDNTAVLASRTLASGMMGGITSPARPWYRLSTPDPGLTEQPQVKEWLNIVTERMNVVFLRSNLYNALPNLYEDIGTFATGAMLIEEDFDTVVRFYTFPIGSYAIALNDKLVPDVFMREFRLQVRQLIQKFAQRTESGNIIWDNFSQQVHDFYLRGQMDAWIDIHHVIQPNEKYDPRKLGSKKYESLYYERGTTSGASEQTLRDPDVFLRERGYDKFPVLAPRWQVTGEDIYGGNCPGMAALGDIRGLQIMQKKKAQALAKKVNPPMVGPSSLKTSKSSILPGDMTYVDIREGLQSFRPAHEVNFQLSELENDIREHQFRIKRAFYEDLFLMIANTDRREITAREIDERHEEKLLGLGPVLQRLNQDLLNPLIDITYDMMDRFGLIPEPPEALEGRELKVEFISIMHQAQQLAGLGSIERTVQFVTDLSNIKPEAIDKLDGDAAVEHFANITGVPPDMIVSDEAVAEIRQTRAEQEQAREQAAQAEQAAKTAQNLSGAKLGGGGSALDSLIEASEAGALQ